VTLGKKKKCKMTIKYTELNPLKYQLEIKKLIFIKNNKQVKKLSKANFKFKLLKTYKININLRRIKSSNNLKIKNYLNKIYISINFF